MLEPSWDSSYFVGGASAIRQSYSLAFSTSGAIAALFLLLVKLRARFDG